MKNSRIFLISALCFAIILQQSINVSASSPQQKMQQVLMIIMSNSSASNIVGALVSAGYATQSDWKKYVCPALVQSSVSSSLGKQVASLMGQTIGATLSYPCL